MCFRSLVCRRFGVHLSAISCECAAINWPPNADRKLQYLMGAHFELRVSAQLLCRNVADLHADCEDERCAACGTHTFTILL
jgi:hypothetical protein